MLCNLLVCYLHRSVGQHLHSRLSPLRASGLFYQHPCVSRRGYIELIHCRYRHFRVVSRRSFRAVLDVLCAGRGRR